MIEIDIAPAPASAPSSPSVPQGAADDFASALENAGGRDERSPATRSSDGARSDDPPNREIEPETAPTDDTDSASVAEEPVVDETTDGEEPALVVVGPAPAEGLIALTAAATQSEPQPVDVVSDVEPAPVAIDGEGEAAPIAGEVVDVAVAEAPLPSEAIVTDVESVELSTEDGEAPLAPETPATEPALDATVTAGSNAAADTPAAPTATAVPTDAAASTAVTSTIAPAEAAQAAEVMVDDVVAEPVTDTQAVAAAEVPASSEAEVTPAPVPVPSAAASTPRTDAALAAVTEAAAPAPVVTPPTATPVDPTAAADAAAMAELDVPTPPQQIAEALRDVRRMADGSHRLSLQLHPEELGVVQLEVAVRDGQLHLRAATELDSTRRLLNASLPELREQLTDAGVTAGSLEVGAETAGGDRSARDGAPATVRSGFDGPTGTDGPIVSDPTTLTAPGRLDVRL